MISIDNYLYDAERLIFYNQNLDELSVKRVLEQINPIMDNKQLSEKLESYDAHTVSLRPGVIERIGIFITKNCNLRCSYCGDSATSGNNEALSLSEVLAYVSDAMKRWTMKKFISKNNHKPLSIYFTGGGEPTYDWKLFVDIVHSIEKKSSENNVPIEFGITTNGVLEDYQRMFISEHFKTIMVSYDGLPEIQNKNRKSVRYPRTSDVVENTIEYFIKNKKKITIRSTLWHDDIIHLKSMADYIFQRFTEYEFYSWSILPVMPTGRALSRIENEGDNLKTHDFLQAFIDLSEYVKVYYPLGDMDTPIFKSNICSYFCGSLSFLCNSTCLLPDKTITTCIEPCVKRTIIGKVTDFGVEYNDTCYDYLLEIYQKKFHECVDCIAYTFCKGGCPVKHINNYSSKTELGNWECEMVIKYWEYIYHKVLSGETCFGWYVVPVEIDGIKTGNVLKLEKNNSEVKYDFKWNENQC